MVTKKYKQSFGVVAKIYKKYRGSYTAELYEKLLTLTKNRENQLSILNLKCGIDNSTEPLFRAAKKLKLHITVTGIDPDIAMLKEAKASAKKNKLPVRYIEGAAEKLPLEKNQFDLIISGAAFHWFANKKAMKQVQRVLKDKGIYAIFWTKNIDTGIPTIGLDLYRKYKWQGIPKEWRNPENVMQFLKSADFSNVGALKTPWTEKKTLTESIGLIKTNSSFAILSATDKKSFIREMTKEYKKALGDKKEVLKQEIHICYGIK